MKLIVFLLLIAFTANVSCAANENPVMAVTDSIEAQQKFPAESIDPISDAAADDDQAMADCSDHIVSITYSDSDGKSVIYLRHSQQICCVGRTVKSVQRIVYSVPKSFDSAKEIQSADDGWDWLLVTILVALGIFTVLPAVFVFYFILFNFVYILCGSEVITVCCHHECDDRGEDGDIGAHANTPETEYSSQVITLNPAPEEVVTSTTQVLPPAEMTLSVQVTSPVADEVVTQVPACQD